MEFKVWVEAIPNRSTSTRPIKYKIILEGEGSRSECEWLCDRIAAINAPVHDVEKYYQDGKKI